MKQLPIALNIAGRSVLVVGGGAAAAAKVRLLRAAGAALTLVAPRLDAELAALAGSGAIAWCARRFAAADIAGRAAVFAAPADATPEDAAEAAAVSQAAMQAGVPVNVVDRPALSSFTMPAIVDRGDVTIGISTAGTSPVLASRLRAAIEALLPARLAALARFADSFRIAARAVMPDAQRRRRFWDRVFDGPIGARVLAGDEVKARELMMSALNRPAPAEEQAGVIHIVGAGPGAPDLLTLRALQVLQRADIVFYDELIDRAVLDHCRREAALVYVGKRRGSHSVPQNEINARMVDAARAGQRVVRLKGGDPFVFGRGGEELDHARRAGIAAFAVPGVSAALGCAAAAGIPLTHRDWSHALILVTGHGKDGEPQIDWPAAARAGHTLVIYMGVATAGTIAARLIGHGKPPETPVAVIQNGSLERQSVSVGRLDALGVLAARHAQGGPALIVVGEVVRQADAWPAEAGDRSRAQRGAAW